MRSKDETHPAVTLTVPDASEPAILAYPLILVYMAISSAH